MRLKFSALDICLIGLFAAFMMIGANITSILPFLVIGGVPITLQTFFAILAGCILGARRAAYSMVVYILIGLVGVPVFAQFTGGPRALFSPTFGFVISYILVTLIIGWFIRRSRTRVGYVIAAFIGLIVNYIFGTNWMYFSYHLWADAPSSLTYQSLWLAMMVPLPKDIILTVISGLLAFRLHKSSALHKTLNK